MWEDTAVMEYLDELAEENLDEIRDGLATKEDRLKYLNTLRTQYQERDKRVHKHQSSKKRKPKSDKNAKGGILGKKPQALHKKPRLNGGVDFGNKPIEGERSQTKEDLRALVKKDDYTANWTLYKVSPGMKNEKYDIEKVRFSLCRIAFGAYSRHPEKMPFFGDVIDASACDEPGNRWELSYKDAQIYLEDATTASLGGFVHHEARVGSTLVANILASIEQHIVYSEAGALASAMHWCKTKCSLEERAQLLQMVVKLMSVSDFHQRVFYKTMPPHIIESELYRVAFPDIPYIFLYREPVEVMMSQLHAPKDAEKNRIYAAKEIASPKSMLGKMSRNMRPSEVIKNFNELGKKFGFGLAPCIRRLDEVDAVVFGEPSSAPEYVGHEEYCAATLFVLCQAAADAIKIDSNGMAVHYSEDLGTRFIESVLPNFFKVSLTPEKQEKAMEVTQAYSKSRRPHEEYQDDVEAKHEKAWPELELYAEKYVSEAYKILLSLEEKNAN